MQLNLLIIIIKIISCLTASVSGQRQIRQQVPPQYCITPEKYYGTCLTLSYCPNVVNVFKAINQRAAQQYVIALQRSCGTRSINGDPVICCTQPQQTFKQPVTAAPSSNSRFTANPLNPFLNPGITATTVRQTTVIPFTTPRTTTAAPPPITTTTTTTRATTTTTTTTTTTKSANSLTIINNKVDYCQGPDFKPGICKPLKDCQLLVDELLRKQNDATFANFLRASNTVCRNIETNVCCPSNDLIPIRPITTTTTSGPPRPKPRSPKEVPRRLPSVEDGCGFTMNVFKKIVGGAVSKVGAWPWVALLGYADDYSNSPFKCGGTLITARHVLTAAHCLRDDLSFVRLGEYDLSTDKEAHHIDVKVAKMDRHPNYNNRNGRSDIAILYLANNVEFNDNIMPICLPATPELRTKSYIKHTPFVVGWGKTMEGGTSSNIIQELQIPIYDNDVCRQSYERQNRLFTANQFDSAVICAGDLSGGRDTCQGDSGGPLMMPERYKNSVRYYLVGIVSYGIGCARPQIPGVYTSTQYFMDWILDKVASTTAT